MGFAYDPSAQPVHTEEPAAATVPLAQAMHLDDAFEPATATNVPAEHSVHLSLLVVAEYFPIPQLMQPEPADAEYFPAAQLTHAVALALFPMPTSQLVQTVEAPVCEEYFPSAHIMHCVDEVLPVPVRYVPAAHEVHTDSPARAAYLPATHQPHERAFGVLLERPIGQGVQVIEAEAAPYLPTSQSLQLTIEFEPVIVE